MKCDVCGKETGNLYDICDECSKVFPRGRKWYTKEEMERFGGKTQKNPEEPRNKRRQSASETIKDIRKELAETYECLSNAELCMFGEIVEGIPHEEPKCMADELETIESLAMGCLALSHKIYNQLFFTDKGGCAG